MYAATTPERPGAVLVAGCPLPCTARSSHLTLTRPSSVHRRSVPCHVAQHDRPPLLQRTISTTVAAQSIGPSEVAVQVSQASLCPCTLTITALQLHLQGGLSCSGREIAGMQPPFPLPPSSAQSFLFFVDHAAAAAASRAALQSCALLSDYVIPRRDLQQLALVTLNPAGKAVPDSGPGAAVPIATPRESGTLPAALVDMVLHAPHAVTSPLEQKAAAQVAKAGATGAAVSLQGSLEEGTAVAAMCTNSHAFRLELPSFSVSNPPTSGPCCGTSGASRPRIWPVGAAGMPASPLSCACSCLSHGGLQVVDPLGKASAVQSDFPRPF